MQKSMSLRYEEPLYCEVVGLKLRILPIGTALTWIIFRVNFLAHARRENILDGSPHPPSPINLTLNDVSQRSQSGSNMVNF